MISGRAPPPSWQLSAASDVFSLHWPGPRSHPGLPRNRAFQLELACPAFRPLLPTVPHTGPLAVLQQRGQRREEAFLPYVRSLAAMPPRAAVCPPASASNPRHERQKLSWRTRRTPSRILPARRDQSNPAPPNPSTSASSSPG